MRFLTPSRKSDIGPALLTLAFTAIGMLGYHLLPSHPAVTPPPASHARQQASPSPRPSAAVSIPPPGSPIVFYNASVWSGSLLQRAVWRVDRRWDERCKVMATNVLEEHGFVVQELEAPHAVRGKREGINLGVHCLSGQSHLLLYAVYARSRGDQGRLLAQQFERGLRDAWRDLSL